MMPINLVKKLSNILRSKRANDLKVSEYCLCIKEYYDMFSSTLKDIPQAKHRINY